MHTIIQSHTFCKHSACIVRFQRSIPIKKQLHLFECTLYCFRYLDIGYEPMSKRKTEDRQQDIIDNYKARHRYLECVCTRMRNK